MKTCNLCGSPFDLGDFNMNLEVPQYMKEENLCFRCAFWRKRLEWDKTLWKHQEIALVTPDWNHFIIGKKDSLLSVPSAFGGVYSTTIQPISRILVINRDEQDFAFYINNNPTHQGIIPEHLRDLYQVNARFLPMEEYRFLRDQKTLTYEYCKNIVENGVF